jgi:hypothetical protein
MSAIHDVPVSEVSPTDLLDQHFVMVRAPSSGYAGFVGAEVVVTDVANGSVYVLFESGMRDCYPPTQFRALFRRRREQAAWLAPTG